MLSQSKIKRTIGPVYASGEFYFLSPDLARFITSPECPREAVDGKVEDLSMGNFVYSHPGHIRLRPTKAATRSHPIKNTTEFRARWETSRLERSAT